MLAQLLGPAPIILYDLEYTAWPGSMVRAWSHSWEHREVVQIAALRFDPQRKVSTASLDVLVMPRQNPSLSTYFQELTGITQPRLDANGLPFAEGYQRWSAFVGDATAYSWGPDWEVLHETAALNDQQLDAMPRVVDLTKVFAEAQIDVKGISSGRLANHFGSDRVFREHCALQDCESLAEALRILLR